MFYQYIENKCWFRIKPVAAKQAPVKLSMLLVVTEVRS